MEETVIESGQKHSEDDPTTLNNITDSPCSANSPNIDDSNEPNEKNGKPTPKNVLLAKKRLLAYSKQSQFSQLLLNSKKDDKEDKSDGASTPDSKSKKEMYPDERAKAVIQEIEAIKKEEEELHNALSRSPSLDKQHFKKREIKCRNFRSSYRSPSHDDHKHKTETPPPSVKPEKKPEQKVNYPRNWSEYTKMKLDVKKDKELKAKISKTKTVQKNIISRFYNFETPSLPIESYRYYNEKGKEEFVPFQYLRTTVAKPNINYSVNYHMNRMCFMSRKELFNVVSEERRNCILKLIQSSSSESEIKDFKLEQRNWYPKPWKKLESNCIKSTEKSVGLSFLQTYSDEEELEHSEGNKSILTDISDNVTLLTEAKKILEEELKNENEKNGDIHLGINETRRTIEELEKALNLSNNEINEKPTETKTTIEENTLSENDEENKKNKHKKHKKKDTKHRKEKKKRKNSKSGNDDDEIKEKSFKRSKSREKIDKKEKKELKKRSGSSEKKVKRKEEKTDKKKRGKSKEPNRKSKEKSVEKVKVKEERKDEPKAAKKKESPDTEEYHSHWESDDDLPPISRDKLNTSWESDEEIFERGFHSTPKPSYDDPLNLEIPLNIKPFSRRRELVEEPDKPEDSKNNKRRRETKWDKKPVDNEMELLKRERQDLDVERQKLEIQKMRIKELELNSINDVEKQFINFSWMNEELPVNLNLVKKEKSEDDFNILDNSLQSVSSTELRSNTSTILENEYEEFLKAVTTSSPTKKKHKKQKSSSSESSSTSDSDDEEETKKKKRKKRKLNSKTNVVDLDDLFPKLEDVEKEEKIEETPSASANSADLELQQLILAAPPPPPPPLPPQPVPVPDENPIETEEKPFVFTSMVLSSKKPLLVTSQLNLDDEETEKPVQEVEKPEKTTEKTEEVVEKPEKSPEKTEIVVEKQQKSTKKDKKEEKPRKSSRKSSPKRYRSSPPSRRRSPGGRRSGRRRSSPIRRHYSPRRRSKSPINRRRYSISPPPRRKSNRRSFTPDRRHKSPRKSSPINSPLDTLKRSVADSTISDDLLAQTNDYDSPNVQNDSPKRVPLDVRINEVLGIREEPIKEHGFNYPYPSYQYPPAYSPYPMAQPPLKPPNTTKVVQMGNMLQIVPTEEFPQAQPQLPPPPQQQKIVQVGNMLQIVPGQLPPEPINDLLLNDVNNESLIMEQNKQSAEAALKMKQAERRAEREKRRQEKEKRRKEKEKRRKEKEKQRQLKLQIRTENIIKKALQMDSDVTELNLFDDDDEQNEQKDAVQWPPPPVIVTNTTNPLKEAGKSILIKGNYIKSERKCVQFADGIRPGEGTSPSGGEELSSPPPAKRKLPKEKRYKKKKKKIKVKVIKERRTNNSDEDDDNLPPPPPPPGSPPPHIFPPRVKQHTINNLYPGTFLPNMVRLPPSTPTSVVPPSIVQSQGAAQNIYRPAPMSVIMPPPPPHQLPHHHGGAAGLPSRSTNTQDPRHHSQLTSHHFNHH